MTNLLHISASPRAAESESLGLAEAFLDEYRDARPEHQVEHWDLWDGSLPEFGHTAATAKMAVFGGASFTDDQAAAWESVEAAFDRFDSADRYLFSVPMWNHGVPYILKQFIDVVSQPGMVFAFDPTEGYTGLLRGKKAAVLYTSGVYGDALGPAFGKDFQTPYFEDWLRWAGVTDVTTVQFRPNLVTADSDGARLTAQAGARKTARSL